MFQHPLLFCEGSTVAFLKLQVVLQCLKCFPLEMPLEAQKQKPSLQRPSHLANLHIPLSRPSAPLHVVQTVISSHVRGLFFQQLRPDFKWTVGALHQRLELCHSADVKALELVLP